MTKFKLIGAALALALPTAAFAADACCCKGKDGKPADCCASMKDGKPGDHAGHDMSGTPKK